MASNINPSLEPTKSLSNFRFWCQKVLPLVYDDSLSYYEVLGKMVVQLNDVIDDVNADTENVLTLKDAFLELQTYVNNFFDDIDQLASYAERAEAAQSAANQSAINAASSASNASASSIAAMNARDTAVTAREAAQASANTATTASENATTKASEAAQSAITAQTAQASASQSATLAATDRSAAQTAANTATTKASEASASATNAETSAENAAQSETNAKELVNNIQENLDNIQQNTQDISELKESLAQQQVDVYGLPYPSFTKKGIIVAATGVVQTGSDPTVQYSDFVPIPDGAETITSTMRISYSTATAGTAFYDSLKNFISGIREDYSTTAWGYNVRQYPVPSGAKYARFTYYSDESAVEHPEFYAYTNNAVKEQISSIDKKVDEAIINTENILPFNLFNASDPDIIVGKKIDYNGNLADNNALCVSGFIPVIKGHTYTFPVYTNHFGTGSNATYIGGYDKNKNLLRAQSGRLNGSILTVTLSTSYEFAYIRVNVSVQNTNSNYLLTPYHSHDNFMVVEGTELPDRFVPFEKQKLMDRNVYSGHENLNNPLYAKKVVFLGDSICEGGDDSGYCSRIGLNNTMLWENAGIGGSTIAITSANKTICTRPITMTNPEFIILEGGTNDADHIGDATGETKPAAFGTWSEDDYGTNDASTYYGFNINTFCGAVDYMCKRMVSDYPNSKIGFIGAHKMGTTESTRKNRGYYIQEAMKICRKWGIPCLNLWDESHLNPMIPSQYTSGEDYLYVDGQHLTHKGYDYISSIISSWMKLL